MLSFIPSGLQKPVKVGAAAALVVAAVMSAASNRYKSAARILPADQRSSSAGMGGQLAAAAAAVGVSVPGQETADAAYVDILNSHWLRAQLLQTTFTFHESRWRFGTPTVKHMTLRTYLRARTTDKALRAIKGMITVTRDIKTKLITITAETRSPDLSQQMVGRMASLLETFILERSQTKGGNKARFAEQRLKEARIGMDRAEAELQKFLLSNRNHVMSPDPVVRLQGGRLEAELKLRQQLVTTLALSHEQALMDEKNDMPILNVMDRGNLPEEPSGPPRASYTLVGFLVGFLGTWSVLQRQTLLHWLVGAPKPTPTSGGPSALPSSAWAPGAAP